MSIIPPLRLSVALGVALIIAGCAGAPDPAADGKPGEYSTDPGARKGDSFGYDGRKWRRGLGN